MGKVITFAIAFFLGMKVQEVVTHFQEKEARERFESIRDKAALKIQQKSPGYGKL